tara:strand:+ start:161 stop:577 length:417 start_codon:yes stop_codon:yes gene_type:complete
MTTDIQKQRNIRYDFVRKQLQDGSSIYAAQQACKDRYNVGIGYNTVRRLASQMGLELGPVASVEAEAPDTAITPVQLPAEMRETPTTPVVQPAINGAAEDLQGVQRWMKRIGAEQLSIGADGKVAVLVRHHFDLGDIG